jgi:hypothetical protein
VKVDGGSGKGLERLMVGIWDGLGYYEILNRNFFDLLLVFELKRKLISQLSSENNYETKLLVTIFKF